jgi:ubiquinone/menaquinone biosynthesis C-methylase UbiE
MIMVTGFQSTIQWYEDNAAQYAHTISPFANYELINRFVQLVPPGGQILDAGCAAGRDSKIFFDKHFTVTGIDITKNLIEIATHEYPEINFQQADFLNIPFQNNSFDGIWAHCSLLHLETVADVQRALQEFHRILKPDGILYISVKQQISDKKTSVVTDSLSQHARFFQWFTKSEIAAQLSSAGFSVISLEDNCPDFGANRPDVKWIICFSRSKI